MLIHASLVVGNGRTHVPELAVTTTVNDPPTAGIEPAVGLKVKVHWARDTAGRTASRSAGMRMKRKFKRADTRVS
jgi:hypothetical protein